MQAIDRATARVSCAVSRRLGSRSRVVRHVLARHRPHTAITTAIPHTTPVVVVCPHRNGNVSKWVASPVRRNAVSSPDSTPLSTPRVAVVVGAGPAGTLTALYLVRLGWRVMVFDEKPAAIEIERSANVLLSRRGLGVLRDARVVLDPDCAITLEGAVQHSVTPSQGRQVESSQENGHTVSMTSTRYKGSVVIEKTNLVQAIKKSIAGEKNGTVSFAYDSSLAEIDFEGKTAVFRGTAGSRSGDGTADKPVTTHPQKVPYDLLVGADGANSATRRLMRLGKFLRVEQNADGLITKRIPTVLPSWVTESKKEHHHAYLHGIRSVTSTPNHDGTFQLNVVLPGKSEARGTGRGERSARDDEGTSVNDGTSAADGSTKTTKKQWTWSDVLREKDASDMLHDLAPGFVNDGVSLGDTTHGASLLTRASTPHGMSTNCSRLTNANGDVALVGSAGHTHWPSLTSQTNASLETAQYLGAALEEAFGREEGGATETGVTGDFRDVKNSGLNTPEVRQKNALTYFEKVRKPQVDSLRRLSERGFGSGDFGWRRRVENVLLFWKLFVLTGLHRLAPFVFDPPVLHKINDPEWSFEDIENETKNETGVLFSVFFSLFAIVIAVTRFGVYDTFDVIRNVVKAVVVGDTKGEGVAVAAFGFVALITAAFRFLQKRNLKKRNSRKGNVRETNSS